MEKTREDSWAEAAVTSTLQLSCSSGTYLSDVCGFGWQFCASVSSESKSERISRRHSHTYTQYNISLSFVPKFLRYASFNSLTLRVTCPATSSTSHFTLSLDDRVEQHSLGTYTTRTGPVTFTVTVTYPKDSKLCLPEQRVPPSQLILETISDSLTTGEEFIDIKFYLCSKRLVVNSSDSAEMMFVAVNPRPLFANSKMLTRSNEYLNTLLCGPFGDSATASLDSDPSTGPTFPSEYDYVDSDSDLEDDPIDEACIADELYVSKDLDEAFECVTDLKPIDEQHPGSKSSRGSTPEPHLFSPMLTAEPAGDLEDHPIDEACIADELHVSKDLDESFECVSDLKPIDEQSPGSKSSRGSTPEPHLFSATLAAEPAAPPSSVEIALEEEPPVQVETADPAESTTHTDRRIGRVVSLRNWAFRTWKALILYVYTDKVVFSYIGSRKHSTAPWSCSPKSMYRLAHEMQHEPLKKLCLEEIRRQLTTENIVHEVFSRFTSQYDEILDIETTFLCDNFRKITNFDEKTLQEIVERGQVHCVKAMMTIIRKSQLAKRH